MHFMVFTGIVSGKLAIFFQDLVLDVHFPHQLSVSPKGGSFMKTRPEMDLITGAMETNPLPNCCPGKVLPHDFISLTGTSSSQQISNLAVQGQVIPG